MGIACAPAAGYEVDFDDAAYTTTQAVVQAATYGHCSIGEAACELNKRLEAATTAVAVDKIKGAIDSLKMAGDCVASHSTYSIVSPVLGLVRQRDSVRRAQMAHDVMLVSVCVMSGGLGAAESALNLLVQAKLHIDLDTQGLGSVSHHGPPNADESS